MIELVAISSTAATALGAYNLARYFAGAAIKKRRQVKEYRALVADVKAAVGFAKSTYAKVAGGEISPEDMEKAKAIAAHVKVLVAQAKVA